MRFNPLEHSTAMRILATLFKSSAASFLAGIFVLISFGGVPDLAYADENSPFALDSSHWISFDHYKEKTHNLTLAPEPEATSPDDTASTPDVKLPVIQQPTPVAGPAPVPAAPTRPINLPVMPGMNKGYHVDVMSTEDDAPQLAQITNIDTKPSVQLPESNWQTAAEAVKHITDENGEDHTELKIRMTYLPNPDVKPIAGLEYKGTHVQIKASDLTQVKVTPKDPVKQSPDQAMACAAVTNFKKKQLQAIQSDRQTLQALQNAIKQLGLQKELSFMAGASGSVDTASGVDISAPSTPPLRN